MSIITRLAFALLALPSVLATAADYFPPPDSAGGWRTLTDATEVRAKAGMDRSRLEKASIVVDRANANGGLLVVRKGYLVWEQYFGKAYRNANPDMASTGKAYTSIACGIMLKEFHDKIPQGLATKVFTPEFLPEAMPLSDPRRADITLGHLLCMTAGTNGEGQAPYVVKNGGPGTPLKSTPGQDIRDVDGSSLRVPLWAAPGEGWSYSSPSPHIASMVLRRVTGMELQDYIRERLAKPMGWGDWGYCLHRGEVRMAHANGAGSIAVHATDALRMGYCLAHQGRWADQQLVPADYIEKCQQPSPFNPHTPWSLQFENNADGHVMGAPRDAFWKSGAGGFCLYIVPSLDVVIYKLGGKDGQYNAEYTDLKQDFPPARADWKPIPRTPFNEGSLNGEDCLRRVLELVCLAVVE